MLLRDIYHDRTLQVALEAGWDIKSWGPVVPFIEGENLQMVLDMIRLECRSEEEFERFLRYLILSHTERSSITDIVRYIQERDISTFLIFSPVKYIFPQPKIAVIQDYSSNYVSVPFISVIANQNLLAAQMVLKIMSSEQLLYQNEFGDTCLHVSVLMDYGNDLIYELILQKQPKLAQMLNNFGRSILHCLLAQEDNNAYSAFVYRCVSEYGANIYQKDCNDQAPVDLDCQLAILFAEK